jgi:adenylate kinase family enzyme
MRILIVGGPSSGKSTLARQISRVNGAPYYELDKLVWPENGGIVSREVLKAEARDIAIRTAWVAEGVYTDWTQSLAEQADAIIWLDIPRHVAVRRLFWRHLKIAISKTGPRWGCKKTIHWFVSDCMDYLRADNGRFPYGGPRATRTMTKRWVRQYESKLFVLSRATKPTALVSAIRDTQLDAAALGSGFVHRSRRPV